MESAMVDSKSDGELGRRPLPRGDRPAHPALKANLLMAGVVLLLILLAVSSTVTGR